MCANFAKSVIFMHFFGNVDINITLPKKDEGTSSSSNKKQ